MQMNRTHIRKFPALAAACALAGLSMPISGLIADRSILMIQVHAQSASDVPAIRAAVRGGLQRMYIGTLTLSLFLAAALVVGLVGMSFRKGIGSPGEMNAYRAAAAIGTSEWSVMPGTVLSSMNCGCPAASSMKSTRPQPLAPVDVGAPRLGIDGRELRRGHGIAEGDGSGESEPDDDQNQQGLLSKKVNHQIHHMQLTAIISMLIIFILYFNMH